MARKKHGSPQSPEHPKDNSEQLISAQWEGPLPPPSTLAHFNDVVEDGAERIFRMAEREQEHRIQIERAGFEARKRDFKRGQILGTILAVICVAASVYTAAIGAHPFVSVALVSLPITALIGRIIKK